MAKRLTHLTRNVIKYEIRRYISIPDLRVIAKTFGRSYECVRLIFHGILNLEDLSRAEYITESLELEEEKAQEYREIEKEDKEERELERALRSGRGERTARRERKDKAWKESLGGGQEARESIRRRAWGKGFKAGNRAGRRAVGAGLSRARDWCSRLAYYRKAYKPKL